MSKHKKKSVARAKPGRVDDLAADVASLIKDRYLFWDHVGFWCGGSLAPELVCEVQSHCRGNFRRCRRTEEADQWMWRDGYHTYYRLLQPTSEALTLLSGALHPQAYLINYMEPAIELGASKVEEGRRLAEIIRSVIWQPWRSKRAQTRVVGGQTLYTGTRFDKNLITSYFSEEPKFSKQRVCVKIEYRTRSAGACRAKGVDTFADMMNFDHRGFWKLRLKMDVVDRSKLELDALNRNRGTKLKALPAQYRPYPRANLLIAATEAEYSPHPRVFQDIRAGWDHEDYPLSRYTVRIPVSTLLGAY